VKLKKSQLKELIRQAIVEDIMDKEIKNPKTGNKIKIKTALQLPDEHPANKKAKDMVAKSPTKDDDEPMDATPAPKGKSKKPMKNPFSKESPAFEPKQKEIDKEKEQHKAFIKKVGKTPQPADFDGDMDKYFDALNQHMKDVEAKLEKEKTNESTRRRFTVKEVRMWMKKLEENRYKKVYNSDARRVAWMVNNEGVELSEMPKSMSKKWTKAQYGRERYLANEFIKSKSEQMTEGKLTEGFKKIAKKNVKYKDKTGTYNWQIESGIDTDVMGGNTPKIILFYQHEDETGFPSSGGNTFWLKHKNGKPYTPQEAKKLVNKISNKKIMDFQRKSQNPSGSGQHVYYVDGKFLREGKLTSEQKLRESIREIIKEQMNEGKLTEISSKAVQGLKDKKGNMWDYHWKLPPRERYLKSKDGVTKINIVDFMTGKGKFNWKKEKNLMNQIHKINKKLKIGVLVDEGKLTEAITGSDRKILFILVRDIVRNLKSKIKNFDVNNKSHLNRVGSSILAIIRAMTYSPDNANYKNFKKYFPKNFNSKLIQKKLKQFHSQNDKVQVTLVTQAIKNELGAGVNEAVRASVARFLYIPKKDIKKAIKVVKSMPMNLKGKVEIEKKPSDKVKGFYAITTEKQLFNVVVEYLATADIGVKTIAKGKM